MSKSMSMSVKEAVNGYVVEFGVQSVYVCDSLEKLLQTISDRIASTYLMTGTKTRVEILDKKEEENEHKSL